LPESFRIDLIGHAQASFNKPLLVPEQLQLDGPLAVSSYPYGTLNVDEGGTLRGELSRPFTIEGGGVPMILSPYGFGAAGEGRLVNPTVFELRDVRAAAFGAGLRNTLDMPDGYQGAAFGIEAARQISNEPLIAHGWRVNVTMNMRF
jgi:hemolysin activation/secretion protein